MAVRCGVTDVSRAYCGSSRQDILTCGDKPALGTIPRIPGIPGTPGTPGTPGSPAVYRTETVGSATVSTLSTSGSSISSACTPYLVGTATDGLVWCEGRNWFYRYTVSGSTVTLTQLTVRGPTPSGALESTIAGSSTSGGIFALGRFYSYSRSGNTLTITQHTNTSLSNPPTLHRLDRPVSFWNDSLKFLYVYGLRNSDYKNYLYTLVVGSTPGYSSFTVTEVGHTGSIRAAGFGMVGSPDGGFVFGDSYSVVRWTSNNRRGSAISGVFRRDRFGYASEGANHNGGTVLVYGGYAGTVLQNSFALLTLTSTAATVTTLTSAGTTIGGLYSPLMVGSSSSAILYGGRNSSGTYNTTWYKITRSSSTRRVLVRAAIPPTPGTPGTPGTPAVPAKPSTAFTAPVRLNVTTGKQSTTISEQITIRSSIRGAGDATSGFIFGGWDGSAANDSHSYSVSGSTVTARLLTSTGTPTGRYDYALTGSATSGLMFGGTTSSVVSDFYSYAVSGSAVTWTRLTHTSISGRSGAQMVGTLASGLIFFGRNSSGSDQSSVLRYTRQSNGSYTITQLSSAGNVYSSTRRRTQFGIAGTASSGVIFGGRRPSGLSSGFFRYTVSGSTITFYAMTLAGTRPAARRQMGMVGNATSGIIFGGRSNSRARYNDAYYYYVSGNNVTMTRLTVTGTIAARGSFAMMGSATSGVVFGGSASPAPPNNFVRYAATSTTIGWTTLAYPVAQPGISAGAIKGDGTSGIRFGGISGTTLQNNFERYTIASGGAATLTALMKTGDAIDARKDFGMVGSKTAGLIFGGEGAGGTYHSDFYRYTVASDTVTLKVLTKAGVTIPALAGLGMVGNATTGLIVMGRTAATTIASKVYRYVVASNTVTISELTLPATGITPRYLFGIAGDVVEGIIYGGASGATASLSDFYRYTVAGSNITYTTLTHVGTLPAARQAPEFAGNAISGLLFGGVNRTGSTTTYLNDCYRWEVAHNNIRFYTQIITVPIAARSSAMITMTPTAGVIYGGQGSAEYNDLYTFVG